MITKQESELQNQISAIQNACRKAHEELEVLLQPLREPLGEYARELKILQTVRFEQETGLKIGDELYPTQQFVDTQKSNGYWWNDDEPLTVGDSVYPYIAYYEIRVAQGANSVGGIPVIVAMRMRHEWLQRYSPVKP